MSQIKFFALGGLGENGKNLYCLEINRRIVIMDAGLKHPSGELLGVDAIIPDFSYLDSRKKDIVGIFISHAHDKQIGAIPMLLSQMAIPVHGTNFAIAVCKDLLREHKMNPDQFDFRVITYQDVLDFKDFKIEYFQTTHSIPEASGIAVHTEDGIIVYATDITFDQNVGPNYQTDFLKLAKLSEKGVLALLSESAGAMSVGHSTTDFNLTYLIRNTFERAPHRIIVAMYSTELSNIQRVVNEALRAGKRISIIGRKAQRLVDIGEKMGYIQIPQESLLSLKFIDETNDNRFSDVVFLVTGERHEPFFMLQRMVKGYDRLVHLVSEDTVMMMCPPVIGTEKIAAKTYDTLMRLGCSLVRIDKKQLSFFHASSEDLKLLYHLLKPNFIVPINGEYRHQLAQHKLATEVGYPEERIIMLDNGEVITFKDGVLERQHDTVMNGSILVDGNFETDINDQVLKERELLSDDGFLMIIANIDARERLMLNKPEIVSRGFIYMRDNEEVVKQIEAIYSRLTEKQFAQKTIDWRVYKESIRFEVQKYLYGETKRKPIVIPVIIDTQSDKLCQVL
ncbi:MAG: ribonuclease J [Candidatus Izemoplasmatales bacterium]|nr:ribonuclease J [Candidatus Izemoplasmatales bacterium]